MGDDTSGNGMELHGMAWHNGMSANRSNSVSHPSMVGYGVISCARC